MIVRNYGCYDFFHYRSQYCIVDPLRWFDGLITYGRTPLQLVANVISTPYHMHPCVPC